MAADFARLLNWLATDDPVRTPDADVFERVPMAQRLVSHFRNPAKPTVALVGPVGSGKTTVGALAQHELRSVDGDASSAEFVSISVWPYDSVEAAVKGILVAVDEVLSRHIVTAPLIGLSSEYAQAVEAASGRFNAVGTLIKAGRAPSEILKTYDEAASAIGIRIVLWVEDLERFARVAAGESAEIRLAPVRALLAELGACRAIQVVLAVAGTTAHFDLEKVARHVEWIQPVPEETALSVLRVFRRGCVEEAQALNVLDPGESSRDELWPHDFDPRRLASAREWGVMSRERALACLCSTPRALKQALRACRDAWTHLRGEVDFDDLLMMSLLRVFRVDVFELVNDSIRELQSGEKRLGGPREEASSATRETTFARRLGGLLEGAPRAAREAVEVVLTAVFPRWRSGAASGTVKPQGFAQENTAYWERYMYIARPPEEESDQRMMRVLVAWRRGGDGGDLVRMLLTRSYTPALVRFSREALEDDDVLRLIREVVDGELGRRPTEWGDHVAPGVVAVWSLRHVQIPEARLLDVLMESMTRSVEPNLALAHSLVYYFATGEVPVVSSQSARQLREAFEKRIVEAFGGNAGKLISSLHGAPPQTLLWSCWGLERVRRAELGVPFDGWTELANSILDAAETAPELVLPQISLMLADQATMLSEVGERGKGLFYRYTFNDARATLLFDRSRLDVLFREHSGMEVSGPASDFYAACVRGIVRNTGPA